MNSKFYVSLEAEELLKEKGYPFVWGYDSIHPRKVTKSEAIDWLESKGIVIEIHYRTLTGKYFSEIHYNKMRYKSRLSDLTEDYKTRLEAEEAAIIKACELL
jgi:ATP-dependent DNA ligase